MSRVRMEDSLVISNSAIGTITVDCKDVVMDASGTVIEIIGGPDIASGERYVLSASTTVVSSNDYTGPDLKAIS